MGHRRLSPYLNSVWPWKLNSILKMFCGSKKSSLLLWSLCITRAVSVLQSQETVVWLAKRQGTVLSCGSASCPWVWKLYLNHMHGGGDLVAQSWLVLCNPVDGSLPGSSVHGISQARILEWVAISFFSRSSWPRDWTWVPSIAGRFFTNRAM